MNNILVSIIVPIYNVEKYLVECLESIIKQSLREIEIICVDDGSTDSSLNIVKRYASKDKRIVVVTKKNSGYGNTMNVGIDHAKGEYIGIVESDDYIKTDMFEKLYSYVKANNCDVVKSDHFEFSTSEKILYKYQNVCPKEMYYKILNKKNCKNLFDFLMMNWTGIYKREFILKNEIRHNETPGASFQDNGFWFQVFSQASSIMFINEAFYYYRQDNPNSSINNKGKVYCICDEFNFIKEFMIKTRIIDENLYAIYIKKKYFNYIHSYNRILDEFKLDFLIRMSSELKLDMDNSFVNKEKLDGWLLSQINRIIDCPELFYVEDTVWNKQQEYNKTHKLLMKIKESKEFSRGIAFKKFLKLERGA